MEPDPFLVTRRSLVERLANRSDQRVWQEFFDTYWKLIYSVARKAGLSDAEAQDAVQETIINVAQKIQGFRYDPSFLLPNPCKTSAALSKAEKNIVRHRAQPLAQLVHRLRTFDNS